MLTRYLGITILACFAGLLPYCSFAQEQQSDADVLKQVLPVLEDRWNQPGGDTALYFILERVSSLCGEDDHCRYNTFADILIKLERRSYLPLAIFLGEEMLKMLQRQDDLRAEAETYRNLGRYHDALGNDRLAIVNLEKALQLFERLGLRSEILWVKQALLEKSGSYRKAVDILPEMETLLARAVDYDDTATVIYLHQRILPFTHAAGQYDKAEEHIVALENIPLSDPIEAKQYGFAIQAAWSRADLLLVQKKWDEAELYYQKALRLSEAQPNHWTEIKLLQTISDLQWTRGNAAMAKSYLDLAEERAERLHFEELQSENYAQKAKIAEAEGRFSDALKFIRKQQFHQEKYKTQQGGFNMESYYLQREKEQLATETTNQELQLQLKNNQLRTTLVIIVLILLASILLFTGFRRQRKAKKALAAQNTLVQQQAEELKSLDVAKSRFFANVSHELRTPLTLILGPLKSALKSGTLDERNTSLLNMARQSGDELLKLVGSLLDLSKLEHGKMTLKETPEWLFPLLQRIVYTFESHAGYLGVGLNFVYHAEKDLQLQLDREKLETILNNLLSNAFKFTNKGGRVEVALETKNDRLLISVADSGRGISSADLPHIFDRFYQSKEKNTPAEGGTGIGLALCREMTALMNGTIWAESKPGIGSRFFVELPMKKVAETALVNGTISQAELPAPVVRLSETTYNSSAQTVLVVEDNDSLADYLGTILGPFYRVVRAGNGREALDFLGDKKQAAPSLILSDLMMPVMDGYQLLEELKSRDATRHIPVIMLTARADARDKLKALRIGVDDYLTKPFDEEELLLRIENLLQNRSVREEILDTNVPGETVSAALSSVDGAWLESFEVFVRRNIASDTLTIPVLAHEFAMSESTLLRQLKRLSGLSTVQYLQEIRLDEARRLLENRRDESIAQIASDVGYAEVRSFSRIFKQRFGKSPSDYINI